MTTTARKPDSFRAKNVLLTVAVIGSLFQWQELVTVGGVTIRPSFAIIAWVVTVYFAFGSLPLADQRLSSILPRAFVGVAVATFAIALAIVAFGSSQISLVALIEMIINATLAGLFGVMVAVEVARPDGPRFASLAVLCVVSLLAVLFTPVLLQGGNPVSTLVSGIRSGDSEVIQFGLFRTAFRTSASEEARANARHSITVVVLMSLYLSLIVGARESAWARSLRAIGFVLAGAWLVLSLSRTSWLAAAIPCAVFAVRESGIAYRHGRLRLWHVGVVLGAFVALQPAAAVVADRVTTTASYEGRFASIEASLTELSERLLFGGPLEVGLRPHNMIISFWLAGGVVAAIGAVFIVAEALKLTWDGTRAIFTGSDQNVGALYAQVGLASTALVRMFTSGGTTMHLAAWLSLGAAGGVSVGRRLRTRQVEAAPEPELTIGPSP